MSPSLQKQKIVSLLKKNTTFQKLINTLNQIKTDPPQKFAGIGILVYNDKFSKGTKYLSLRPQISPPTDLILNGEDTIQYLRKISDNNNILHDGYVFANKKGFITHVAQYLEVRFDDTIKPHREHGTRYLSSLLISKRAGVEFIGNVSSNLHLHIFISGNPYYLEENQALNTTLSSYL